MVAVLVIVIDGDRRISHGYTPGIGHERWASFLRLGCSDAIGAHARLPSEQTVVITV